MLDPWHVEGGADGATARATSLRGASN